MVETRPTLSLLASQPSGFYVSVIIGFFTLIGLVGAVWMDVVMPLVMNFYK